MNERELRHSSYTINSSKETREREFFDSVLTKYFNITKWIHHPEDSWYNNGEIQTFTFECPEGFVCGRLWRS